MKERKTRSVVKTISWRLTGTADTILISYLLTNSLEIAASIGGIELVTKMLLYYLHERVWAKVKWGLKN
tara:strand:+ start:164905 stop:165111 length:207 start_codon:yes stop_codon:yes gene_type:complete